MALKDALLQELEQEAQTTRRLLDRVPTEHFSWRPHPKARTLGALAIHVATVPGLVAQLGMSPSPAQAPDFGDPPTPAQASELGPALDRSIETARQVLGDADDQRLTETWRLLSGDRELVALPRVAFLRAIMLNHWYHHRGQLSVYLRALDVPLPSIYGPSADENPFL